MKQEMENNKFDDLEIFFRNNLEDNEAVPSRNVWKNIEYELDKDKRRRAPLFWWLGIGLFVILSVGGFITYNYYAEDSSLQNKTAQMINKGTGNNGKEINTVVSEKRVESEQKNGDSKQEVNSNSRVYDEIKTVTGDSEKINTVTNVSSSIRINTNGANGTVVSNSRNQSNVIQIGSFRNKPSAKFFSKIPYPVYSEQTENGLTRYYVETRGTPGETQKELMKAGIKDVYIPDGNVDLNSTTLVYQPGNNNPGSGITMTTPKREKQFPVQSALAFNQPNNVTLKLSGQKNNGSESKPAVEKETHATTSKPAKIATNNNQAVNTGSAQTSVTDSMPVEKKSVPVNPVVRKDSAAANNPAKDTVTMARNKKVTKDTIGISQNKTRDTTLTPEYRPMMAFMMDGGLNFNLAKASSGTEDVSHQTYIPTITGNLKFQFAPIKWLAFNGGVGYSNYVLKQGETKFYFDKNLQDDYVFNTLAGPVSVSKDAMLEGFYVMAPIQFFPAEYKYSSFIQALNISFEGQVFVFRNDKLKVWTMAGYNSNYILTQSTQLSVIKENVTNTVNYNNVRANRVNHLLLFGLGCDVRIKGGLYFTASPVYKYSLSNISGSSSVSFKPQYISGVAGIKYVFKNP